MRIAKLLAALAGLALAAAAPAFGQAPQPSPGPVSIQQVAVPDAGHAPIPVVVWAPAAMESSQGGNPGRLPLVVMSHGTGAGPLSHVDTAQALAASGFVVAAPMHPGDNFQDDSAVGTPEWLAGRSRHVSRVVDFMLGQWSDRDRLDPRTVGLFGFSAGATTALISIGGTPDLAHSAAHCAARPEFVCQLMAPQPASAASPQWVRDPRIAAAVIAAPGLGFAFEPSGFAEVDVPVQLWVAGQDQTVPYATNAGIVRRLLPSPPEFHQVDGAAHLSFLAPCGPDAPPQVCQDPEGFDRVLFHREFNRSVIAFFRRHLGGG